MSGAPTGADRHRRGGVHRRVRLDNGGNFGVCCEIGDGSEDGIEFSFGFGLGLGVADAEGWFFYGCEEEGEG